MTCICGHEESEHKLRKDGIRGGCTHKNEKSKCGCKKFECGHWRLKKNYPFGKKSKPVMVCLDCGGYVTPKMIRDRNLKVRGKI